MSKPVVIDVSNVSLSYKLYKKPVDLLWEGMFGGVRHDTFWALRDVSLQVHEGQRLGLIGPNGAGKSTLLQIIAGNMAATSGKVSVHGKISSLLSLSPVWNGEDSGIENVKFNLMVQGVPARKISELTEEIIDFTDLGAFMYQPVKTFSSGMSARLAFAIATAIEPEILIIDEVLGAGDGYFAAKATRRMQAMCERGKALVFVSHSTGAIRQLCNTCVWLENGMVQDAGPAEVVLRRYEEDMMRQDEETLREGNRARIQAKKAYAAPNEFVEEGLLRVRICSSSGAAVQDTHYVRKIAVDTGAGPLAVPLELADIAGQAAALELFSCQWGRIFAKGADLTRTLHPRSGSRKGGHVFIRYPAGASAFPLTLEIESSSLSNEETLSFEVLDVNLGAWRALAIKRTQMPGGWTRTVATTDLQVPMQGAVTQAKQASALTFLKPVEIQNVEIRSFGNRVASVDELQPFSVQVTALHNERVPKVSINLNVIRSDGTYAFYQPSGINDNNIKNHLGRSVVEFHFDPNPFGAGDYELNVFAVNGFDWNNIPPSEIFDKSMGDTKVRVNLKRPIEFGLINVAVGVETRLESPEKTKEPVV
jgi:lipopolysaccharide transport system ATP-binding protein